MNWWEKIKRFFRKEAPYLMSEELDTIFDHERIDFDAEEFERIDESFRMYAGDYDKVKYKNTLGNTKERDYMHLNMMNEVSKHLGSILFNEQCEISFETEAEEEQDETDDDAKSKIDVEFIEHVLEHNDFLKNMSKYIQVMLATGGLTVKPYYDKASKEFKFSWALADSFIPLKNNTNNISEGVVPSYSQVVDGDKTYFYTLLEFHEWGDDGEYIITNELYRSEDETKTGKRVDLAERYEGLEETTVFNEFTRPNFAYVSPFGFNNINPQSPLGLGIADNAKTTLKQINETYDQFWWEIKQGKRKIAVPEHMVRTETDIQGQPHEYFDDETDVFLAIMSGDMDNMSVKDLTMEIRSREYIESINKFISTLEMQVGLSAGTFTFDGKSVKTATEVVSENSITYRTRNSHLTSVEHFIQELIISLCELARETKINDKPIYTGRIPRRQDILVNFDDGIFTDKASNLEWWSKATMAGLAPRRIAMEKIHDLSDEDAKEWLQLLMEEESRTDPFLQQKQAESSLLGDFKP